MSNRRIRVGIDVGGTFTKAVGIDTDTMQLCGVAVTPTTHDDQEGVAKGVVYVFNKLLCETSITPDDVVFIAHSTTQATNSLLEGDVSKVGIVSMGSGAMQCRTVQNQTCIDNVEVAPNKMIPVAHEVIDTSKGISKETARSVIKKIKEQGAHTLVATEAFGVDDPTNELLVMEAAREFELPATGSHEISQLYGLKVRTRTAVINASILKKMIDTAKMTECSVRSSGTKAPLMVMRGDGGVMEINEMRKRPILTALSGPAASVAGVLFYLKVSNGIYFEVGGTSTNIGVIKNGKPMIKYVELGGHSTYLHSLDVRVLGVAGGSMPRVRNGSITDVGPRSAHIAGLPYSAFADPRDMEGAKLVNVKLKEGDPTDYVAVETPSGKRYAITNTCAGNALGIIQKGDYSYGNPQAALLAIKPLADAVGMTVDEAAEKILEIACAKVITVVKSLIEEYKLEDAASELIGAGGGVAPIIRYVSKKMGIRHRIPENSEVISSIGDALAMVRESIEKSIINPTPDDILRLRKECELKAIASGAKPGSIESFVHTDTQLNKVIVVSVGSTEFVAKDVSCSKSLCSEEKLEIISESMSLPKENISLAGETDGLEIYMGEVKKKSLFGSLKVVRRPVRIMEKSGTIRVALKNGVAAGCRVGNAKQVFLNYCKELQKYDDAGTVKLPETYLAYGSRIFDMSGLSTVEEHLKMMEMELLGVDEQMACQLVFGIVSLY